MPRLTEEQIRSRALGMGATDIVEVALSAIGQVPWADAGPMRVFARKRGLLPEDSSTPEQEWGHTQEEVILAWYERHLGTPILPGGTIYSRREPWMWATIDAKQIGKSCTVEVKNVGRWMAHGWDENQSDGIPHHVRAQVVIGMFCAETEWCDAVASIAGMPPAVWRIPYDEALAEMLVASGKEFWERTALGEPPPLDASDATRVYLQSKYPKDADPIILDADERTNDIGLRRLAASCEQKKHESIVRTCDAELMSIVGEASGVRGAGWRFSWKLDKNEQRRSRFTVGGKSDV